MMGDDNTDPSIPDSGPGDGPQETTPDAGVGYGRPPMRTRFKKGQSGNPRGRPRGAKNLKTLVEEEMFRTVEVREAHGRTRRVPLVQAALRGLVARSVKDNRAAVIVFGLLDRIEAVGAQPALADMGDLLATDLEIMKRHGQPVGTDAGKVDDDV